MGGHDGRDDVPIGCADSRAVLADDKAAVPGFAIRVRRRLSGDVGVAGVSAYGVATMANRVGGDQLSWSNAGRPIAGATLLIAAVYELTPLKDVCLGKCRSPLGVLLGSWRDGLGGAVRMGADM